MSKDSSGVGETPKDGTTGGLSTEDKGSRGQKDNPQSRKLEIGHLDRTHDYKHQHYSWKDVAAATHATEGCDHDE